MRYAIVLVFFFAGFSFGEDKDNWPPQPLEQHVGEPALPTEAELAKLEAAGKAYSADKDSSGWRRFMDLEIKFGARMERGAESWSQKEFEARLNIADRMGEARKRHLNQPGTNVVWKKFPDWAAAAKSHAEFFKRLVFGIKREKKFPQAKNLYRKAVRQYMEADEKSFPDLKSKLVFCQQLISAGIQDAQIPELMKELKDEENNK